MYVLYVRTIKIENDQENGKGMDEWYIWVNYYYTVEWNMTTFHKIRLTDQSTDRIFGSFLVCYATTDV